jgi:hypothetical protein
MQFSLHLYFLPLAMHEQPPYFPSRGLLFPSASWLSGMATTTFHSYYLEDIIADKEVHLLSKGKRLL